jgi:hypothetical protein
MTDEIMNLRTLLEKSSDADSPRSKRELETARWRRIVSEVHQFVCTEFESFGGGSVDGRSMPKTDLSGISFSW